uniref:Uncharacterized protein n=1 Tax=Panagrolaimus davidi TaxID=227884 RepID=A0A914PM70_9BILA
MVRLMIVVAICLLAVLSVQAWIDHPEHFMLDVNCGNVMKCGPKFGEAVTQVCGAKPDCDSGIVTKCCSACTCDDIKAACCPKLPL